MRPFLLLGLLAAAPSLALCGDPPAFPDSAPSRTDLILVATPKTKSAIVLPAQKLDSVAPLEAVFTQPSFLLKDPIKLQLTKPLSPPFTPNLPTTTTW